jgi:hypothetical protein
LNGEVTHHYLSHSASSFTLHASPLPHATRTLRLIATYLAGVDAIVVIPLHGLGAGHPLRAWQEGRLPARGKLRQAIYEWHLPLPRPRLRRPLAKNANRVRLRPAGRHDGFTPFYLHKHVRLNKTIRRLYADLDLETGLAELEQANLVFRPAWDPTHTCCT